MAKRTTDTTKWMNPSFRKLPTKYKVLYLYLLDVCDCVGVMHLDLETAGFLLGESFSLEEMKLHLDRRIIFLSEEKIIIRNFIAFQYGDITDSRSSMAKTIRTYLNTHGIYERYKNGEFGHSNKAIHLWN